MSGSEARRRRTTGRKPGTGASPPTLRGSVTESLITGKPDRVGLLRLQRVQELGECCRDAVVHSVMISVEEFE
jgi:hypothetical protein